MKLKNLYSILTIVLSTFTINAQIEVEIIDGLDNAAMKSKIENNASRFMSEVYSAYNLNRALNLSGLVKDDAEISIEMLWKNVHFRPEDQYIGENLLHSSNGYQIRNIPLVLQPQDCNSSEEYKKAVLNFDRNGNISEFYFSFENNTYKEIMGNGEKLNDTERRIMILDYIERVRTAYNMNDFKFLRQAFDNRIFFITGKIVNSHKKNKNGSESGTSIEYIRQTNKQLLSDVKRVFSKTRNLKVDIDDVVIKRHGPDPNIYGVRVVQHWNASNYSDEGYVFMVWDFSNPDAPQIRIRTWQPMYLDKAKTKPLPEDEIFDLNSIEGI